MAVRRINLFVFAAHHSSSNIASQRFKGLLKYMDFRKYRIFIFSREPATATDISAFSGDTDITVMNFPGYCVGSESSKFGSLLALLSAFFSFVPFLANRLAGRGSSAWLVHALAAADKLCRERMNNGEACISIGTYSPLDALIAARCLSIKFRIPCLQDFRDGLTFEALGQQGGFRAILKVLIEDRVVKASTLVTSVSRALVGDFERRYPGKKVGLMPNGYDPSDFSVTDCTSLDEADQLLMQQVPEGKRLIGHFGRIGASDHSSIPTLQFFVKAMNANAKATEGVHLLMAGELTPVEHDILGCLKCSYSITGVLARPTALNLMKACDALLLVTGDRVCCATGKLFEYLAADRDVICFSGVTNEASHILAETGAGQTVLTADDVKAQELLDGLFASSRHTSSRHNIGVYSKVEQVKQLDQWLTGMVA